jgi:hypothetical protein
MQKQSKRQKRKVFLENKSHTQEYRHKLWYKRVVSKRNQQSVCVYASWYKFLSRFYICCLGTKSSHQLKNKPSS